MIYEDLRRWAADPATAPDPARVSWVSIGNPENRYGGKRPKSAAAPDWLPADTAYPGTEVIRQYDGWADWPDDPRNLLAVANAVAGMFSVHSNYRQVDLNDPANVHYTPEVDGQPGNVTYAWVPTKTLPLVAWAGPLAPALDNALRPVIEKAYHRPVDIPDPTPPTGAVTPAVTPSAKALAVRSPVRAKAASKRPAVAASSPKTTGGNDSARHRVQARSARRSNCGAAIGWPDRCGRTFSTVPR
ncbi:PE-PPE domain-containing protein [Mycolicibacterium sp. CBM1]